MSSILDRDYGQYVLREDPEAIPEDRKLQDQMTGIEITNGGKIHSLVTDNNYGIRGLYQWAAVIKNRI